MGLQFFKEAPVQAGLKLTSTPSKRCTVLCGTEHHCIHRTFSPEGLPSQPTQAGRVPGDTQTTNLNTVCLLLKALQQQHRSHSIWTMQLFPQKFARGYKRKVVILTDGHPTEEGTALVTQIFAALFSYPFRDQKRARSKQGESWIPDKPRDRPGIKMGAHLALLRFPTRRASLRAPHKSLHLLKVGAETSCLPFCFRDSRLTSGSAPHSCNSPASVGSAGEA